MNERGKFLVFEGGAGSGKSSFIKRLSSELQDQNWNFYREPGSTPFGELVRNAVQQGDGYEVHPYAALFGYMAARANLVRGVVIPNLESGINVGCDRYWYSTYSYQGSEGVSKRTIILLSKIATKNLKPDLVLHFDLEPAEGVARKMGKNIWEIDRYDIKDLSFHQKVRQNYHELGRKNSDIWVKIDASRPIEEVYDTAVNILRQRSIIK